MVEIIKLVRQQIQEDSIGQQTVEETEREVFCEIESVSRAEWRDAGQNNIAAEMVAITPMINYGGEQIAIVGGKRKAIYRTYRQKESDLIELYLKDEVGAL